MLHSPACGIVTIDMWQAVILNGAQRNEESLMSVAILNEILRCATIDMWWAVILNGAKRNEESLTLFMAVAALEGILRCAQNDRFGPM